MVSTDRKAWSDNIEARVRGILEHNPRWYFAAVSIAAARKNGLRLWRAESGKMVEAALSSLAVLLGEKNTDAGERCYNDKWVLHIWEEGIELHNRAKGGGMNQAEQDQKPFGFKDFKDLPPKVYPTSVKMLEQNGDILIYREADEAKWISPKQNAIFKRLVRVGESQDSDCRITVLVVTGLQDITARTMTVYDYTLPPGPGFPERVKLECGDQSIPAFVSEWFNVRRGGR